MIAPAEYCTPTRIGGQLVPEVVEPRKVADLVAAGATLVLQSIHRHWPVLTEFSDALTSEMGHPVQINAYLTPPGGAGLRIHADEHDVFAVELDGTKQWWVDGLGDLTLRAGDVLYVPAGCRHGAHAEEDTSLHLTVGVLRVTYRQVIDRILRAHDADLDASLPLGYRMEAGDPAPAQRFRRDLERALGAAVARLQGVDVAETVSEERQRALVPIERGGHLWSAVHADRIDADTAIRWVAPPPRFAVLPTGPDGRDWMRLQLADRSLRLPAAARGPIEFMARGGAVKVGELPGLDDSSQGTLARRLVEERACVIAVDVV